MELRTPQLPRQRDRVLRVIAPGDTLHAWIWAVVVSQNGHQRARLFDRKSSADDAFTLLACCVVSCAVHTPGPSSTAICSRAAAGVSTRLPMSATRGGGKGARASAVPACRCLVSAYSMCTVERRDWHCKWQAATSEGLLEPWWQHQLHCGYRHCSPGLRQRCCHAWRGGQYQKHRSSILS